MSTAEVDEFAEVMERVRGWSPSLRIALAKGILDSLQAAGATEPAHGRPDSARKPTRGLSAEEIRGLLKTDRPPPDDESVKRWIDEHRMEKYG
jgi:hypothetical protein